MQIFQSISWLSDFAHWPSAICSKHFPGPVDFAPKSEEAMGSWQVRKQGLIATKYLNLKNEKHLSICISDPSSPVHCHESTFLLLGWQLKPDRCRAFVRVLSEEWWAKKEIAGFFFLVLTSFAESICGILKEPIHMHGRDWQFPFQNLMDSIWETEAEKHAFRQDKKMKIHSFLKDPCSLVIYMQILICYKLDEFKNWNTSKGFPHHGNGMKEEKSSFHLRQL